MRIIQNEIQYIKQIKVKTDILNIIEIVRKEYHLSVINLLKEFTLIIFEEGDYIYGNNIYGINNLTGGLIGIKYDKVRIAEEYYILEYIFESQKIIVVVNEGMCNSQLRHLFLVYMND